MTHLLSDRRKAGPLLHALHQLQLVAPFFGRLRGRKEASAAMMTLHRWPMPPLRKPIETEKMTIKISNLGKVQLSRFNGSLAAMR